MTIKDPEISENTKQDKLQKKNSMLGVSPTEENQTQQGKNLLKKKPYLQRNKN